jgi:hypothetical protein
VKSVGRSRLGRAREAADRNNVDMKQQTKSDWFWRDVVLCNTKIFETMDARFANQVWKIITSPLMIFDSCLSL